MKYPKPEDRYSCEVFCENFMEIENRLQTVENGGGGGSIDETAIQEAVDAALAEAKQSGEFDGKDGAPGVDGADGQDGKSAYEYAQDGGYTGTEEEFATKLAQENPTTQEFEQLSSEIANMSKYVAQPNAPEDTSAIWIDTDDEYDDGFSEAVQMALREAKASGMFDGADGVDGKDGYTPIKGVDYVDGVDGKDGEDGKDGADGKTPVKGTDYFTAAEKAEMVNEVLAAIPVYSGEVI